MKNISIYLKGGLGNQLFQIAFLYCLAQTTYDTIVLKKSVIGKRQNLYFGNMFGAFSKFINKEFNFKKTKLIKEKKQFCFANFKENDIYIKNKNICFNGYFQNVKYFEHYLQSFKTFLEYENLLINNNIIYQQNTIALHLRFGDYLKFKKLYVQLPKEYYINAIKRLVESSMIDSIIVFHQNNAEDSKIHTEYIEAIKSHYPRLKLKDIYKDYDITEDWKQLLMISQCDNIIIANSTFSLWGAYLSNHTNVCYPSEFFCDKRDVSGLFLKSWHKV